MNFLTSVTATSFTEVDLNKSTQYSYEITAVDFSGNQGIKSDPANATTDADPDTTPPAQIIGLIIVAIRDTQIDLSWTSNNEPDFKHYLIFRDNTSIGTSQSNVTSDTGLVPETSYTYQIAAVDNSDNKGLRSDLISVTTTKIPDLIAPGKVQGLVATVD